METQNEAQNENQNILPKSDYQYDLARNLEYFNHKYKIGDKIKFKEASNKANLSGMVENRYSFGLVTVVDGKQYKLSSLMDIELVYPPLRSVKVTFSDGNVIETNMAAHLKDEEMRSYYAIGREFNLGSVEDRMVKVVKVEILK